MTIDIGITVEPMMLRTKSDFARKAIVKSKGNGGYVAIPKRFIGRHCIVIVASEGEDVFEDSLPKQEE